MLVREGFSWGALFLGRSGWLAHRAWIAARDRARRLVADRHPDATGRAACPGLGLALILGLTGRDLVRWSLERRGYLLAHVLAARDTRRGLVRLLTQRPDLAARFRPEAA